MLVAHTRLQLLSLEENKMKNSPTRIAIVISFLFGLLAVAVPHASADTTTFNLGTGNDAISGFTGPFATVLVNRTSTTTATITFTSLTSGGNIYLLGDGGSAGVNVNATSWTLGTITGSNAGTGFTPGPFSNGGAGNLNGFGSFNQTINSFDGYTSSSDTISFGLTNTSGTWAAATNVLTGNSAGNLAGAHIFVTSSPANASIGALATGFASGDSGGTGHEVPEPSAFILLGVGLLALVSVARRFNRAN